MPLERGYVSALIPLPLTYNPDAEGSREPVEDELLVLTAEEAAEQFGGGTLHVFREGNPRGFWWDRGFVDQDVLAILEVDIPDEEESRDQIKMFARSLIRRFRQKAIYVKFIGPIETLFIMDQEIVE
jgi:hypothetical protein